MLKDITIGQYFAGDSLIHRLDPRIKLILTMLYIAMVFIPTNPAGLIAVALFVVACYGVSGISLSTVRRSLKPILPIVVFTTILNIFFIEGRVLVNLGFVQITYEGLLVSALMVLRIVCLIAGTSLLTYTTSPIALTDAIERLFAPMRRIGVPVHELAMMMTIALRFIPTLIEETDKIMAAQKARGADMESGGLVDRVRALIPILVPLFVSAFRRALDLATAMECRCYRGGEGRTRMRQMRLMPRDMVALVVTVAGLAGVIMLNGWLPSVYG
jgi:energy-coupling factor transport system permease protein